MITELAEDRGRDHVLESISGHLSRRMLEHYSHIRIDAKRQALDALDEARRGGDKNGSTSRGGGGDTNGSRNEPANAGGQIPLLVALFGWLTSQFDVGGIPALH